MTSTQTSFKSVLSAITSLSPLPPPSSPYSLSAILDSPVEGEKHTQFTAVSPYDCDTDSPSCYDSDSLLNYTSSSQLESVDTLDTSVSWYCRGDSAGYEEQDGGMYITRSGERTPLSPDPLNSPAPLLDSKVFILRPVKLLDDDYDFTCAGPEDDAFEDESHLAQIDDDSNRAHHYHHHHQQHQRSHRPHHHHRHNITHHNSGPRPHLHPHLHEHHHTVPQKENQATISHPQFPTNDRSKRRWSAPISPSVDILIQATRGIATGTLDPSLSSAGAKSSGPDRLKSDVDIDAGLEFRTCVSPRGRASNKKELQITSANDARFQALVSTMLLHIPAGQRRGSSSETSTPRTWPRRRNSEIPHLSSELPDVTNLVKDSVTKETVRGKPKERSKTLFSLCASNKWGNQPPNGYI